MCKVTVVVERNTGKLVPFQFKEPFHEVEIYSGYVNPDNCIVRRVNTKYIDWDTGYVTEETSGKKTT
jgi:hypothetical protein